MEREECLQVLRQEKRGVLSVLGEDGYPYGVPLDHWYCEEDGKLYFHAAKAGHKLDAIRACDKVSYCVYDQGYQNPGEWAWNIRSVILFGRMEEVTDPTQVRKICLGLCEKLAGEPNYFEEEFRKAGERVCCLALTVEHMTGKLVNES